MHKVLHAFKQKAKELMLKDKRKQVDLQNILFSAPGKISEHNHELELILDKYVLLQADKCRGNYILVCKNLYIKQCIHALHTAPEYQRENLSPDDLKTRLLQEVSGLLHHPHFDLLIREDLVKLPYFYTLPKPHKVPIGWRPVAAMHNSVFAIPQRVLSQCFELVLKTLKNFHHKEYKETKIRKFWIVENSLDVVHSLPKTMFDMFSSDNDSMYQNMDQNCVIESTSTEVLRAAEIAQADGFFVVVNNTSLKNPANHCF
jgi:hypothetical protein